MNLRRTGHALHCALIVREGLLVLRAGEQLLQEPLPEGKRQTEREFKALASTHAQREKSRWTRLLRSFWAFSSAFHRTRERPLSAERVANTADGRGRARTEERPSVGAQEERLLVSLRFVLSYLACQPEGEICLEALPSPFPLFPGRHLTCPRKKMRPQPGMTRTEATDLEDNQVDLAGKAKRRKTKTTPGLNGNVQSNGTKKTRAREKPHQCWLCRTVDAVY